VNETHDTPQSSISPKSIILWLTALVIATGSIAIQSCGNSTTDENSQIDEKELKIAKDNEALVKTACANCHAFVPADKLDKTTWEAVIKEIGRAHV
jgi:cytochrome c553